MAMRGLYPMEASAPDGRIELPGEVVCRSDDLDKYRASVNSVFYPARLEVVGAGTRLSNARLSAIRLSHLTIGIVRFGAEILLDPGDVGGYHVNVPVCGSVASRCGAQATVATPKRAAVFTPNEHTILPSWSADATQVCIKIERATLESELAKILGRPVNQRVQFDIGFDMTTAPGRRWWSTLQILLDAAGDRYPLPDTTFAAQAGYLERSLIVGLLLGQSNSMTEAMHRGVPDVHPRALQKVVDLIHEVPGAQHTIADLAGVSGVGVRQLQALFHDHFDMSPSTYVRNVRLDKVRSDLLQGNDSYTVGAIAFRWGFNHLGRFAQYYQQKFGEAPSQTLRR